MSRSLCTPARATLGLLITAAACGPTWADTCAHLAPNAIGDCTHYSAGTGVTRAQPSANQGLNPAPPLGEIGFSISIDEPKGDSLVRRTIAGAPARPEPNRTADAALAAQGVVLTYDGLAAGPRLAVATGDMRQSYAAGEVVRFRASTNYPQWIARAEIIVRAPSGALVARLPVAPNGEAIWTMPAPTGAIEDAAYMFHLQVYDRAGRRDDTHAQTLTRSASPTTSARTGPIIAAGEGDDMTQRRRIPLAGGALTVTGQAQNRVSVMGEEVPLAPDGRFVTQRLLPPGTHRVEINVDGSTVTREVEIKASEWFTTGILDLTLGHDDEGGWKRGQVAGFVQGTLADGTRITGSVDTEEGELRDLFENFGRKNPDQTLREMRGEDVFATFGDDSQMSELAPTSGKVFVRAARGGSHLQWGDFKPQESSDLTWRSDRALYGLSGRYVSPSVTASGENRVRLSAFAAQADTLTRRDVLRATGGSAYFLSRQDVMADSETVLVQVLSRTTGLIVESRRLVEGQDYRMNHVQGVVMLNAPLASHHQGPGLVSENPLGDFDVNLVVQYEYEPTLGDVGGHSAGLRSEAWLDDHWRLGASVLRETTDLADNDLGGLDLFYRPSDTREVSLEFGRSKGPGFGSNFSLNGGLDLEAENPSYGLPGLGANSWRLAARSDLDLIGLSGEISGYVDEKEAGFSAPDGDYEHDQTAWGLAGAAALSAQTDLTFGSEGLDRADGRRDEVARLGLRHRAPNALIFEGELAYDQQDQTADRRDFGTRSDLALRVTWARDGDRRLWVFGQATLDHEATRRANDRIGLGASQRLNDRVEIAGELSDGRLGPAARVDFGYQPNPNSQTTIGYRLDPLRQYDSADFSGRDKGSLVFEQISRLNDYWSYTTESRYSAFGTRPSLTSGYGVTYSPSKAWIYDGLVQYGETREPDGTTLEREGLSLGLRHNEGETRSWGLRGEWRQEQSNRPDNALDRETWLATGFYETKTREDWRFLSSLDSVISQSDQASVRDGRYIEARLGYAWRPVAQDDVNALLSYSYLYDMPGPDQVNIDGDLGGDRQKSHILNAALNWKAHPSWTLGVKVGLRDRARAARDSEVFTTSRSYLTVLRADYHIIHQWDVMAEVRNLKHDSLNRDENAALLGVYRLIGPHVRLGGGYLWGEVDDDLRKIEPARTGFFLNLTSQF